MKRSAIIAVLAALLVFPAIASAVQYFSGYMGAGGAASQGSYATRGWSRIDGTYVPGREYRAGFSVACCGGSSYYVGTTYISALPVVYSGTTSSAKGYCSRSSSGSGSSIVSCSADG